jgi:hypothetical protein
MEKLNRLLDATQFAAAFGAATRDSDCAATEAQGDATGRRKDGAVAPEAGLRISPSEDGVQMRLEGHR